MTSLWVSVLLAALCALNVAWYLAQEHQWINLAAAVFIGVLALSRPR